MNTQLERVDGITSSARTVSSNVSVLTSLFTATLGGPLVRAAAFSYGLNKAIKARRAGRDAGAHSRARPPQGGGEVKRLFWLGLGLAVGVYASGGHPRRPAASRRPASGPTSPTACGSWVPAWVRSAPRCAPG